LGGEKRTFIQKKQHLPVKKVLLPLESRIFRYSITTLMENADFIGFYKKRFSKSSIVDKEFRL
jgi:hypothetical protein